MANTKKTIGICWGCWDGVTAAHLAILKFAKENCDYLIVGVSDDDRIINKGYKPIMSFEQRLLIVSQLKYVDKAIPQTKYFTKQNAVDFFKPDLIFVGAEYKNKDWDGAKLGIPVYYIKHKEAIHSSDLR